MRAAFKRGGQVVAAARGVRHSDGAIALRVRRGQMARGRYNLVLTFTVDGHRTTVTQRVRVSSVPLLQPRSTQRVEAGDVEHLALLRSWLSVFDTQ